MLAISKTRASTPVLSLVVLSAALAWPAGSAAAPVVTEYSPTSPDPALTNPTDVARGPDGNVWFTEDGNPGAFGRITPAGAILDFPARRNNSGVRGITTGSDGNLWYAESSFDTIDRATPAGVITPFLVPGVLGSPLGVTAGPDGNLWFTESGHAGAIERVTPGGVITQPTTGLTPNRTPSEITTGPDGNIWFTETTPAYIGKLDLATLAIQEYPVPSGQPSGITSGPDGNVWFTARGVSAGASRIDSITPSGTISEHAGLTVGLPVAITSANDGNLYFTEAGSDAVGSMTPLGAVTEYPVGASSGPHGITAGADGNVWFAEATAGRMGMITIAPAVSTGGAGAVDTQSAILTGTITPDSQDSTYYFDYGTSTMYGSQTRNPGPSAGAGASPVSVTAAISGLSASTTYHFRAVATNGSGVTYGADRTFATPPPTPGPPSPGRAGPLPGSVVLSAPLPVGPRPGSTRPPLRPVLGSTVLIAPVFGTVLIRRPGARRYVRLAGARVVPLGSTIDAGRGTVALTSATNTRGATQRAHFRGGAFKIGQTHGRRPATTIVLAGGDFAGCPARSPRGASRALASRRRPVRARQLWGHDDHGSYTTRGRGAVATVRGTIWLTRDTCSGTLVRVRQGTVAVRDLKQRRTVLVAAHQDYLARL